MGPKVPAISGYGDCERAMKTGITCGLHTHAVEANHHRLEPLCQRELVDLGSEMHTLDQGNHLLPLLQAPPASRTGSLLRLPG